jgi:tetratricopeptide (TPR) repeat protein
MKVGIWVLTVFFLTAGICYAQSQSLKDALEYASTGDFSEARNKFEKILEDSSGGLQMVAEEYLGIIKDVSRGGIKKETAIHIFKAINYSFNGMQDNAITEYKKAIDIDPSYIVPRYYLATTYASNEMYKETIDEYKKIVNIDPNATRAYLYLAQAYAVEGKWDEVIPSLKKVIEITQDSAEAAQAHYGLAAAYYDKKQYQLAIKHCDEAIKHGLRIPSEFLKELEPYRQE